ncbi:hypothetical protein PUN28_008612 [Cardiocondyla obscurior]|uniref:CDT1 Geminin-binding domain-containing protein n=2 Tax=Cardiocondyla obscurior TaxID=286306 RepID=A0AAW2G3B1_9HYME
MSQPSVTAYFNTRKRQACDDLRGKSKVLLLEQTGTDGLEQVAYTPAETSASPKLMSENVNASSKEGVRLNKAVRSIQFDSSKTISEKASRPKARATRSRPLPSSEGNQVDIRDSFLKKMVNDPESKKVLFEKKGTLSPRKKASTPKKAAISKDSVVKEEVQEQQPATCSFTPTSSKKLSTMERLMKNDNLSIVDIKNRINKSPRLAELKALTQKFANHSRALEKLQKRNETEKPQIKKLETVEIEIPISPQKAYKSPSKRLLTPTKNRDIAKIVSPQRQILLDPKEKTPSPGKSSPVKAYQKYLYLVESKVPGLALPYNYRFLAEIFRCVDTVSAMLFNRKELITFTKLKPAVQELLRRNFTQKHLAQIKTIYPDAYTYHQENRRNFASISKEETYELVITPVVQKLNGRNTPDADNILKSGSETRLSPTILLERRKKFNNYLIERVKSEHEKFLISLETPNLMNVPREKIVRWHPEFDVESCKEIEQAELPQPPHIEKLTAKDVLDKAKSLFNCGTRMEKALQRLAEANLNSKSTTSSSTQDSTTQITEDNIPKVNITVVDTPSNIPSAQTNQFSALFKGIPKALLEKVRAKQAARALEAMTRTPNADKEAALYSRLPELAKLLRNIFVAEKKSVLSMDVVVQKLDNSFRIKLTLQEIEEHIRELCKLLPMWANIHNVRKADYLKLDKNIELAKVIKRLEILAENKINPAS